MELKDVILSTLAEMDENVSNNDEDIKEEGLTEYSLKSTKQNVVLEDDNVLANSELFFLNSIRERLLVLFEGFQAPNNSNIEAKVDMTLNFLEYTLATIDERVHKLEKGN